LLKTKKKINLTLKQAYIWFEEKVENKLMVSKPTSLKSTNGNNIPLSYFEYRVVFLNESPG